MEKDAHGCYFAKQLVAIPFFDDDPMPVTYQVVSGDNDDVARLDDALERFLAKTSADRLAVSKNVRSSCNEFLDAIGAELGNEEWENEWPMLKMDADPEVWDYVRPTSVDLEERADSIDVILSCDCDWETEHGLKIVFANGVHLRYVGGH
jgi:hypothetical protein